MKNDNFTWQIETDVAGAQESNGYLYANFSQGQLRSSTYLDGPLMHETSATCFMEFWYHIGSDITEDPGALNLILQLDDTETTIAILDKSLLHNHDPLNWQIYMAEIGRYSGEFRFVFQAKKGTSNNGYIGLDEIMMDGCGFLPVVEGVCPDGGWKCPVTRGCVDPDLRCDFTDDCGQWDDETECDATHRTRCDFDDNLCDWYNHHDNQVQWVQINGPTATSKPRTWHNVRICH